ncbi:MAG TPA: hypothetical protein VFA55_02180 [Candidatus Kapabacteria bacterium]|nr:hypothetical protein [Candidatus Kapabacteria bacterium]
MLLCSAAFCQKGSSISRNANSTTAGFFPLSVGNRWAYRITILDSNGVKVSGPGKMEYDTIVGTENIGERTAYVMHTTVGYSVQPPAYFAYDPYGNLWSYITPDRGKKQGYWTVFTAFGDTSEGAVDTFFVPALFGGASITDTIQQIYHGEGPLPVPAGSFNIREYTYSINSSFRTAFLEGNIDIIGTLSYARGVGKVKEMRFSNIKSSLFNTSGGIASELVSYSVK